MWDIQGLGCAFNECLRSFLYFYYGVGLTTNQRKQDKQTRMTVKSALAILKIAVQIVLTATLVSRSLTTFKFPLVLSQLTLSKQILSRIDKDNTIVLVLKWTENGLLKLD